MVRPPHLYSPGTIERLPALDGMRGVAALIVVLYHSTLVARPFLDDGRVGDGWWWLTETPFKLLTAGTEAVLVFFVLSGLVVALPTLVAGFSWTKFLTTRFLRLYLPVWAALLFAAALILVVPRPAWRVSGGEWIDTANARSLSLPSLLSEASLFRVSYDINNVLWSLRWEIIFTLALPLFVVLAVLVRRWWIAAASVSVALTITGRLAEIDALVYLPVFFLGTLMAVRLPELQAACERRSARFWRVAVALSLLLMIASWIARPIVPSGTTGSSVLWALAGVGAAGLIVVALGSPAARALLTRPVIQWLGRVSFSLYLVHVPILATVTFVVGDERWWLAILISVPASLALAQLFFVVVEKPAHRFARSMGSAASSVRPSARRGEPAPTAALPLRR